MALDLSGTSTALPVIIHDLNGSQFEWIGSAYSLAATALMPLSGSLAQVFGRRVTMLLQIFLFAAGSAICGAAPSLSVLIVGRTIQGCGAGGINALNSIVISDLVPLKERGKFQSFISIGFGLATTTAPVIAGAFASHGQWRWFFYMNIPICAFVGTLVAIYVDIRYPKSTLKEKMESQDWWGNILVIASTSAVVFGLTDGGIEFPWSSPRILVPLILGVLGLVAFLFYEAKFPRNPVVPLQVASTVTGISGYIQSMLAMFYLLGVVYYYPVYFQACKGSSPVRSGINSFGLAYSIIPPSVLFGISVARTGRYRPQIWFAWVLLIVGAGLLTTIRADTKLATAIGLQVIPGVALGVLLAGSLYPVLAPIPQALNASAIALYMFFRYFSQVWAVTVGGTVLQNELGKKLPAEFLAQFPSSSGTALAYSVIPVIATLDEPLRTTVREAFADSLRVFWFVLLGVGVAGLACALLMEGLPLKATVEEDHAYTLNVGNASGATRHREGVQVELGTLGGVDSSPGARRT
ncbi:iron permease [Schizopora paradoxa]|uniref:Iron permease n=1 Tax=Schizopora paradoxa TaxID=27342 RepID=A0A0H2RYJ4_9AGAM|nr:iron permease [Schizopora paradoxa]